MQPQQQWPYEEYADNAFESKREKRRRDMVDRVSRLHADTLERRDRVFHDLSEIFARTADELLPPPVFPTFDLSIPVGQLPPSLPFTDPVIPDMHPTPYLFSLHRLSLERSNQLLGVRLFNQHQIGVAKRLYEAEVERIEDEYEGATKGVVDRLLEGVEERRKRLTEEKEGEGVNLDTFLDPQRTHGTRRVRGGARLHTAHPHKPANGVEGPSLLAANGNGHITGNGTPSLINDISLLGLVGANGNGANGVGAGIADPFNLAAALLPSAANPLLSALSGAGPTAALLHGGLGKRKAGQKTQPGLPPAHFLVQSGQYHQFGKSLAGLSALRGDEIDGDLGEVRRKRPRVAGATSRRRNVD